MGMRKDIKVRVLKAVEGQRPNGTFDYRYTDAKGKRRVIYAKTLDELRQKETELQKDILDGIDHDAGEITVVELAEKYMNLRRDLKQNSIRAYQTGLNRIRNSTFGKRRIKTVKKSDAIAYLISFHDQGLKQNTIGIIHNLLRPAFEMAVEDDAIRKNPFKLTLSEYIPDDEKRRESLTKAHQKLYLSFIQEYGNGNYYDDILILLNTGLRVSELYGLTKADIDLNKRYIRIDKQLCRTADKPYFITEPKTKSGFRNIPLTDEVCWAFQRVLENRPRPKVEKIVDGYGGFLFLDKDGKPKVGMHLQNYMRQMQKKLVGQYGKIMPSVTPHVLRHTFCTNMAMAGIDAKSLQTIMGHSNISVTYDIYTHVDYETVERAFFKAAATL